MGQRGAGGDEIGDRTRAGGQAGIALREGFEAVAKTGLAVAGAVQGGLEQLVGTAVVPGTVRVGFGADRGGKGGTTG